MKRRLLLISGSLLALSACHHDLSPQDVSVVGLVPDLAFEMTDVQTNRRVTQADFAGKTVLLFFGYTNCPDECPTTLYSVEKVFKALPPAVVADIVFLYVTVDPDRDTVPVLAKYTAQFGPNIIGLRGTADELYTLARRYRVVFSVSKKPTYEVTHSAAVYVFDPTGAPRFIIAGLDTGAPDIEGIAADLKAVTAQ